MKAKNSFLGIGLCFVGGCMAGCKATNHVEQMQSNEQALAALERGNFAGDVEISAGGKFGGEVRNGFFLGPDHGYFRAAGRVDYSRNREVTASSPSASGS